MALLNVRSKMKNVFNVKTTVKTTINVSEFQDQVNLRKRVYSPLNRAGAITRGVARRRLGRIRPRTRKSKPGQSPFTHVPSNALGLKRLTFDVDKKTMSVIVGPWWLNTPGKRHNNYIVPEMLEFGGSGRMRVEQEKVPFEWEWDPILRRAVPKWESVIKPVRIARRPYMRPALEVAKEQYPELFKGLLNNV